MWRSRFPCSRDVYIAAWTKDSTSGVLQHRQLCAGATHGEGSHCRLRSEALPQLFFLLVRVFLDLGLGFSADAAPSVLMPGETHGARIWRSPICDEVNLGLDCFSSFHSRVMFVISMPQVVIFCFLRGLSITLDPPIK